MGEFLEDAKEMLENDNIGKDDMLYYFVTNNAKYLDRISRKADKGLYGKKSILISKFINQGDIADMLFYPQTNELIDLFLEFYTDKNITYEAACYLDYFFDDDILTPSWDNPDYYFLLLETVKSQIELIIALQSDEFFCESIDVSILLRRKDLTSNI